MPEYLSPGVYIERIDACTKNKGGMSVNAAELGLTCSKPTLFARLK